MSAKTPIPTSKNPINKMIEIPIQNRDVNCPIYGQQGQKDTLETKFKMPTNQDIIWSTPH
jgi:hypothetical protein